MAAATKITGFIENRQSGVAHKQRKIKTMPEIMESLIGTMFVGYAGLPVLNKPCDLDRKSVV